MAITTEATEDHIRAAYTAIGGRDVSLTAIRQMLTFIPRGEQDRALRALALDDLVHFNPEPLRHRLTADDHDAAIRIGGEDMHLIWME